MLSALNNEIEQLYNRLFTEDVRSVAICSSQSGEGATTIATLLAQRCLLMGKKTLLVDLNVYHPSFRELLPLDNGNESTALTVDEQVFGQPQLIELAEMALVGITAPKRKDAILKLRNENVLNAYIKQWHSEFECIVVDTTALSRVNYNNIPGDYVAKACDGAVLVVEAGKTPEESVEHSLSLLKNHSVNLLGTVLNDHRNPPLKHELLRELSALKYIPNCINQFLERKIKNSKLLNLSI